MAVKIRLQRFGKKKQPVYRVVVMDGRKPRDGRYLEAIGRYEPRQHPSLIEVDNDRALDWLMKGAQPTETAQKLLEISGAWARFKVAKGEIYTVGEKPAPVIEEVEAAADADATEAAVEEVGAVVEDAAEKVEAVVETVEAPAEPEAEAGEDSE
ncbi:MAG: 30S ribosomal protein S16 [Acidimicrobiia bacterium]|nr:30S ribosomal protein S16 [Acidimicrobiia bacterium]